MAKPGTQGASPIEITIDDRKWIEYAYQRFPRILARAAREAIAEGMDQIGIQATSKYMTPRKFDPATRKIAPRSGPLLNIMTSRLARSINEKLSFSGGSDEGEAEGIRKVYVVGSDVYGVMGSKVPYAAIHEFGGKAGRGGSATIPKRPYLSPAVGDKEEWIRNTLELKIRTYGNV